MPPCCTRCGSICSVVVPSRAMRSFTAFCGAVAERDHGDDGGDADDDAEHREQRPQLVGAERREGDTNDFADQHGRSSVTNDPKIGDPQALMKWAGWS